MAPPGAASAPGWAGAWAIRAQALQHWPKLAVNEAVRAIAVLLCWLSVGCEPPGSGTRARQAPPDTWTPSARSDPQIRAACYSQVKAKVSKRVQRRQRARVALNSAEDRLRVVQGLGDPPTVLQAMKDRDTAAAELAEAEASPEDPKALYDRCTRLAFAEDAQVRAEQLRAERERAERQQAEEERATSEAWSDAFRVLGAAAQGAANAVEPRRTSAPAAPVDRCAACIQQWCSFQCSGIGNDCPPCMKQWCDFEC
jgi:hypothetical protein